MIRFPLDSIAAVSRAITRGYLWKRSYGFLTVLAGSMQVSRDFQLHGKQYFVFLYVSRNTDLYRHNEVVKNPIK